MQFSWNRLPRTSTPADRSIEDVSFCRVKRPRDVDLFTYCCAVRGADTLIFGQSSTPPFDRKILPFQKIKDITTVVNNNQISRQHQQQLSHNNNVLPFVNVSPRYRTKKTSSQQQQQQQRQQSTHIFIPQQKETSNFEFWHPP